MNNDNNRTSGFYTEANQRIVKQTVGKTSGSSSDIEPYSIVLPSNINIFSDLADRFAELEDLEVAEQVKKILLCLYQALQKAYKHRAVKNYLSRMNLVQQDDKTALIEWNFQDFRVGFTLEPVKTESSYFVLSQDKNTGSFMADTQKLNADISQSVNKIVEYVLGNT